MPSQMPRRCLPLAAAAALVTIACSNDTVTGTADDPATAYWSLGLDQHGITMAIVAPYDTLRLTATPRTVDGTAIAGLPPASFTTSNGTVVAVDSSGLLTAVELTPGTTIIATLTARGITHADTAIVAVTDDPAGLTVASLSLQPLPGDSAKYALGGTLLEPFRFLTPTVLDQNGDPMFGLPVHFTALDVTTATIDPFGGVITAARPGPARFTATLTAYGQQVTDTVQYTIGLPGYARIRYYGPYDVPPHQEGSFDPDSVRVGLGAVVEWWNFGLPEGKFMDMLFDNPAPLDSVPEGMACLAYATDCDGTGSIPTFGWPLDCPNICSGERFRARRFTQPGVYHYQSTIWGTQGVIVVVDESVP
jgi:hypothetical protein